MNKLIKSKSWRLITVLVLIFSLLPVTVGAQNSDQPELKLNFFEVGAPTMTEFEWTAEPPTPTDEQLAQAQWGIENTHLTGPARDAQAIEIAGPMPGTETSIAQERERSGQPLAPGDPARYMFRDLWSIVPSGFNANVMESSTGIAGVYGFYTGNWFAARTNWGGFNWLYTSPWTGMSDFCCDQITLYDEARDRHLWVRMGIPDANNENRFLLSVANKTATGWWTYSIPTFWANQFWDYPHVQLGADYMYLSWNVFGPGGPIRTVMLMISLDDLAAGNPITIPYAETIDWFTWVPVQGAYHIMYWASNWPWTGSPDRIGIWRISEDYIASGGTQGFFDFRERTIPAWTIGSGHECPLGGTYNWLARTDDRLLTGARYSINSDGVSEPRIPGRKVLGWWWNARQGGGFPLPYIEGAAFYEDTMDLVPGNLGRPLMWGSTVCFGYPSITPNKRQDLGAVVNFAHSGLGWAPRVGYSLADDYSNAPPGWTVYEVWNSRALPSNNVWGDYNTAREYEPTQKAWVGAAHVIRSTTPCTLCSHPIFFIFGRDRDRLSWFRWRVAGP